MDCNLEKECSALGGLFQSIVNEMKHSYPAWEDLGQKAVKLSAHLKATIVSLNSFLDALQRVADVATNAKGSTRDIGTALTRICMRHRSIENRLKTMSSALIDCMVMPLQEKQEDWKNRIMSLDKEHSKEYKRTRAEIKKRSTDTIRLQKKVRKGESRIQPMLESVLHEVNDRYLVLVETERKMVRQALTEQRAQFCYFVSYFKPVLDLELGLIEEASHLQDVTDQLCSNAAEPHSLPPASEAVIYDIKGLEHTWTYSFHSPPSSPTSSLGSRKSSFCSLSSAESSEQYRQMLKYGPQTTRQQHNMGTLRKTHNQVPNHSDRISTSQDSGFVNSQDVIYAPILRKMTTSDEDSGSTPESLSQQSTPSPSPSAATWPDNPHPLPPSQISRMSQDGRPHTISVAYENGGIKKRPSLTNAMFATPPEAPNLMDRPISLGLKGNKKQKTPVQTPTPTVPQGRATSGVAIIPDFNAVQPDQYLPQPIYANLDDLNQQNPPRRIRRQSGSTDGEGTLRARRPLSFVGDQEDMQRLLQVASMGFGSRTSTASGSISNSGSNTTVKDDDDDTTLIDDALESINQLSADLDKYDKKQPYTSPFCTLPRAKFRIGDGPLTLRKPPVPTKPGPLRVPRSPNANAFPPPPPYVSASTSSFASVLATPLHDSHSRASSVIRRGSSTSTKPPPPVPLRRNSTITAATPTAPSIDAVRTNSRCTTPIDENYTQVMHTLNMRFTMAGNGQPMTNQNGPEAKSPEFSLAHETMLMQIRNGIDLRKPPYSNDKSRPKI